MRYGLTYIEYKEYINNAIQNEDELKAAYKKLADVYKLGMPYEPEIAVQLKQEIRAYNRRR